MRGVRFSEAERASLISSYHASGLSVRAFSTREGVGLSTLHAWLAKPNTQKQDGKIRMARVIRASSRPRDSFAGAIAGLRQSAGGTLLVECGNVRVHVPSDIDRQALAMVLDVVSELTAR